MRLSYANRAGDALVTGPEIFPAIADVIAQAEAEVDIAFYVFDRSDAYDEIMDGLARLESRQIAAGGEQPVIVRIVVDAQKILLRTAGPTVRKIDEGVSRLALDPNHVQVMIATYEHFTLGNLHTKLVVIDGKTALLGGANVQKQHDYANPWMDSFHILQGEVAGDLLADFDQAWNESRQWVCRHDSKGERSCEPWTDAPGAWHPASVLEPDLSELEGACIPTVILSRTAWGGFNNNVDNPMDRGILAAIDTAHERVFIQTPNLNDDAVRDALIRALSRGVKLQLLLSKGFNDAPMNFFGGTNEEVAASLAERAAAEAPDHADKLLVRWYSADGIAAIDGNVSRASHLKFLSIDGQLAVVGSTNMDTLAWNHSRESNVAVDHAGVPAMWDARVFEPNWQRAIPADAQ